MATTAIPIRDIKPGDSVKTAAGIQKIQLKVSLPAHRNGTPRWRIYFYDTTVYKDYMGTECLHKVITGNMDQHSTLGRKSMPVPRGSTGHRKPLLRLTSPPNV